MVNVEKLTGAFQQQINTISSGIQGERAEKSRLASLQKNVKLDIGDLEKTGVANSNNPLLQRIWQAAQSYNHKVVDAAKLKHNAACDRIVQLDGILYWTTEYLLAKSRFGERRNLRKKGLETLSESVVKALGQLNVKALANQSLETDNHMVWLERVDPEHREVDKLKVEYKQWIATGPTENGRQVSFLQYLQQKNPKIDKVCYDAKREPQWKMAVYYKDGRLKNTTDDQNFDTSANTTFSGIGWAIFVGGRLRVSPQMPAQLHNNSQMCLFSGNHVEGSFYHSSFLSGMPVAAAGEWLVTNGIVRVIKAKSGHYQPTIDDMFRLVTECSWIPGGCLIAPAHGINAPGSGGELFYFQVGDFRKFGWSRLMDTLKKDPKNRVRFSYERVCAKIREYSKTASLNLHFG